MDASQFCAIVAHLYQTPEACLVLVDYGNGNKVRRLRRQKPDFPVALICPDKFVGFQLSNDTGIQFFHATFRVLTKPH